MTKRTFTKISLSLLFIVATLLSSCTSHKPALNAHEWVYAPNAITIDYVSDRHLNRVHSRSHTLLLAVMQTTSLQKVQHFLQTPQGIGALLEQTQTQDQAEHLYVHRYYISPGEKEKLSITRMAGMKFVVLVAAYSHLIPDQSVKIFDVPIDSKAEGIQIWKRVYYPAPLHIHIHFGEQGILKAYSIR